MTQAANSLGRGTRTALLLRQNTSPKYRLPSFPVQRYLSAPTQPNQGRASITFTSRLPLPTVHHCPSSSSSHYLQLQLHNDDLTSPAQLSTTGLSKEQSSHKSSTLLGSIHLSLHALRRPQCKPNQGLTKASSRIDLDQYRTPYIISPADIHLVRRPLLCRNPLHISVTIRTLPSEFTSARIASTPIAIVSRLVSPDPPCPGRPSALARPTRAT